MSTTSQLFPKVPLGTLFDLEYGAALPESIRTRSGFPVFGSSGTVGRHSTYFAEGPGIIVGRKGSVGQVSWSSESFWPIDTAYYVVPKEQNSLRWIYWLLSNIALKRLDAATGVPGLNRNDVYAMQVHRPEPAEQSRIAAVLDMVDEVIAKTEAVIAKLKQVRAGLLHDLLTRGLDEYGQLRDPSARPEHFQASPLGRIPREWRIEPLGGLFDMQLGKMLSPKAKGGGNLRPYVGNRHVLWERCDCTDLEYMDFTAEERSKFALRAGDLLVCEGGEVGRTALWRGEIAECYFQKAIHRLRPKDDRILPNYMLAFMKRAAELGAFTNLTSQTSIAHLTQEKLALLLVVLPPREEQSMLVAAWSTVQAEQDSNEDLLAKLTLLKSGLMADLLTGRVRVPEEITVAL